MIKYDLLILLRLEQLNNTTATGATVRRFENIEQHTPWDTGDESGNQLANGMYFVILDHGRKRYSQPVLIIR